MPLTIKHDAGEWDGTFGVLVETLVKDLLSDGLPFHGEVLANGVTYTGAVCEITPDRRLTIDLDGPEPRTEYVPIGDVDVVQVF